MPLIWIVSSTPHSLSEIFQTAGWEVVRLTAPTEQPARWPDPDVALYIIEQDSLPAKFGLFCELKIMPILAIAPNWSVARQALDAGADDVLIAPIDPEELLIRAHKLHYHSKCIRVGELAIDLINGQVKRQDQIIFLSPIETSLLTYLARNVGQVVGHDELLDEVWKCHDRMGGTRDQVKAAVKRLRQKIEPDPGNPQFVIAVKKVGYRLRSQRQWEEELGFRGSAPR